MTFEQLEKAGFVTLRECSICGSSVGYEVHPYWAAAVFNPTCDCGTGGGEPNYRMLTRDELSATPVQP